MRVLSKLMGGRQIDYDLITSMPCHFISLSQAEQHKKSLHLLLALGKSMQQIFSYISYIGSIVLPEFSCSIYIVNEMHKF